jgi:DNA-binding transcriptional regulator YiaG
MYASSAAFNFYKQAREMNCVEEPADEYRRQNGLLTSSEINARRNQLQYTQEQFAGFLGVNPVSIKRWETWQVQKPIYDKLIRDKYG